MFNWLKDHFVPHEGNDHHPPSPAIAGFGGRVPQAREGGICFAQKELI